MRAMKSYRTQRLLLRPWRASDREAFARLNADPAVMEHFPKRLDRTESDRLAERIEAHFIAHGFGPWAIEAQNGPSFIGFVGLAHVGFEAPFTPSIELLWRLARDSWGRGYATEAAREACRIAWTEHELSELVSFTVTANQRSRAVMERIGMRRDPNEDFEHPELPEGHALRRHVLYRLSANDWRASTRPSSHDAT